MDVSDDGLDERSGVRLNELDQTDSEHVHPPSLSLTIAEPVGVFNTAEVTPPAGRCHVTSRARCSALRVRKGW